MSKKEKEIEDFNNSVDRLNQIKQMISEGFALNDIKDDPMDLLKKKQADLKAEKKAIEDDEKAEAKRIADEKKAIEDAEKLAKSDESAEDIVTEVVKKTKRIKKI